jgi:hypothetical protein
MASQRQFERNHTAAELDRLAGEPRIIGGTDDSADLLPGRLAPVEYEDSGGDRRRMGALVWMLLFFIFLCAALVLLVAGLRGWLRAGP